MRHMGIATSGHELPLLVFTNNEDELLKQPFLILSVVNYPSNQSKALHLECFCTCKCRMVYGLHLGAECWTMSSQLLMSTLFDNSAGWATLIIRCRMELEAFEFAASCFSLTVVSWNNTMLSLGSVSFACKFNHDVPNVTSILQRTSLRLCATIGCRRNYIVHRHHDQQLMACCTFVE